jgi:Uma2 family endonuclease
MDPPLEWIRGRAIQKVSPKRRHAVLQAALTERLRHWARGRGQVGSEWHFRVTPAGDITRPLVPDIAFLSYDRMRGIAEADLDMPRVAPELIVEILSPDDRADDVEDKRNVYLAAGVSLVLIVDPLARTIDCFDSSDVTHLHDSELLEHVAFPDLRIPLAPLFAELDIP